MTRLQEYIISKIEKYIELHDQDNSMGHEYDIIEFVEDLIKALRDGE